MNTYIITLLDQNISDKKIASLLFKKAVYHDKSCKKLAKKLSYELKADYYELRYFRSMKSFYLRLGYKRNKRDILLITLYHNMEVIEYLIGAFHTKIKHKIERRGGYESINKKGWW